MPERMQRLETLLGDPDLGLIAHVTRVDRKVDDGMKDVNTKLDLLLEERAHRRPFMVTLKYGSSALIGAIALWVANYTLPKHP
jgi:uncharacterized membrane protein YjjP (DUF1212 family)